MSIFDHYRTRFEAEQEQEFTIDEFLQLCKEDKAAYASAAERLLMAIGEPEMIDTSQNPVLSRIFSNRIIARYPAFAEFYGMEDVIANIVAYCKHAAQRLEERKQVLYLLGPVGGGKSSIAERLKSLMESFPIYALKGSPINESPLGLFDPQKHGEGLEQDYGIAPRYLNGIASPWAIGVPTPPMSSIMRTLVSEPMTRIF